MLAWIIPDGQGPYQAYRRRGGGARALLFRQTVARSKASTGGRGRPPLVARATSAARPKMFDVASPAVVAIIAKVPTTWPRGWMP